MKVLKKKKKPMTIYRQFHVIWLKSHVDKFGSFQVIDKKNFFFCYICIDYGEQCNLDPCGLP